MTVFEQVELPNPLDYVANHVHEGKIESARLHLADVSAKCQENEDPDMTAWYSYFKGVVSSYEGTRDVPRDLALAMVSRRSSEDDDAKLLFHAFTFLSDHNCKNHGDDNACTLPPCMNGPRQVPGAVSGPGHLNPSDRLWSLARFSALDNPFSLINSAKLMEASYHDAPAGLPDAVEASAAICSELGIRFLSVVCRDQAEVPAPIALILQRQPAVFAEMSNTRPVNEKIDVLISQIDAFLAGPRIPSAAILEAIAKGLTLAGPLNLKISTARLLTRLARLRGRQDALADAILLLDDIEGTVLSNCSFFDVGIFFSSRAEALLALASQAGDEKVGVLCDALKAVQLAISAFDKGFAVPELRQAVTLGACLTNKLGLSGMCNFYSVKFQQISADSGMRECFFPTETGNPDSIYNLGQPKIPSELTNSPKAKDALAAPMSPVGRGRGLQTLIRWSTHNKD